MLMMSFHEFLLLNHLLPLSDSFNTICYYIAYYKQFFHEFQNLEEHANIATAPRGAF